MKRVRDGFLKKKLALTESDSELDAAVRDVITKMHGVRGQGSFDWLFAGRQSREARSFPHLRVDAGLQIVT